MFSAYKAKVIQDYQKKREARELSLNLLHSSPAKLREECLDVLQKRYLKKDDRTIRAFFKHRDETTDNEHRIRKSKGEIFKTLDNYLKGVTADTNDKNIELLAWLINYEPRPYQFGLAETIKTDTEQGTSEIQKDNSQEAAAEAKLVRLIETTEGLENTVSPLPKSNNKKRARNAVILTIVLTIAGAGTYIWWTTTKPTTAHSLTSTLSGACMYWSEDHYEPVPCDQKANGRFILALDTLKLANFKLITENDTVSPNSVRKVWYFKTPKGLELYTDSGFHPVHVERRLKPLTRYMWDTYLSGK